MDAVCRYPSFIPQSQDSIDRIFDLLVSKLAYIGRLRIFFCKPFRYWKGAVSRIAELLVGLR